MDFFEAYEKYVMPETYKHKDPGSAEDAFVVEEDGATDAPEAGDTGTAEF